MIRLLIVERDAAHAAALSAALQRMAVELAIAVVEHPADARERLRESGVDLLLVDLDAAKAEALALASWVAECCTDTCLFVMSAGDRTLAMAAAGPLGALDCFAKPLDPSLVLAGFAESLDQFVRGHVRNLSLASFLQLLEMERKTCRLAVSCGDRRGVLTVRRGVLVHARIGDDEGDAAAIAIVAWPRPTITLFGSNDSAPATVQKSLGFIVMEAMRVEDEAARGALRTEAGSSRPGERRAWRSSGPPRRSSQPPVAELSRRLNGDSGYATLSSGAHLLAVVDSATGAVLQFKAAKGSPVDELARSAWLVLEEEIAALSRCNAEGLEELVLSTTTRCDVIRPLGADEFALLVFAPEDTNLVMARLELEQFIASAFCSDGSRRDEPLGAEPALLTT